MDKNQFSLHCLQQPLAVSAKSLHETKATSKSQNSETGLLRMSSPSRIRLHQRSPSTQKLLSRHISFRIDIQPYSSCHIWVELNLCNVLSNLTDFWNCHKPLVDIPTWHSLSAVSKANNTRNTIKPS